MKLILALALMFLSVPMFAQTLFKTANDAAVAAETGEEISLGNLAEQALQLPSFVKLPAGVH